jgi:hypothetical protein
MTCAFWETYNYNYRSGASEMLFYQGQASINTVDYDDDTVFSGPTNWNKFSTEEYVAYGFSRYQWFGVMESYEGGFDYDHWLNLNQESGLTHFFRFMAIGDNRLDIGDTLDLVVAEDEDAEVLLQSIELASGVSLAASAAAVLACATLL